MDKRRYYPRKFVCILAALMMIIMWPITAKADMGPKPEINITIVNFDEDPCYATLIAYQGGASPVSFGDWDRLPENIKAVFNGYEDPDGGRFIEDVWIITKDNPKLDCGYMPPSEYKLLLYFPNDERFLESNVGSRYAFESNYIVDIGKTDTDGKLMLEKERYDYSADVLDFLKRLIITLIIELGIAYAFKIRGWKSFVVLLVTNVITQMCLTVRMSLYWYQHGGGMGYLVIFAGMEIMIATVESIVYAILLKRTNTEPISAANAAGYGVAANVLSWIVGGFIGIFI